MEKTSFIWWILVVPFLTLFVLDVTSQEYELNCKGVANKKSLDKLSRLCDDCYNLFRNESLFRQCRKECFTSMYFKSCIIVLQLRDEFETIKQHVEIVSNTTFNWVIVFKNLLIHSFFLFTNYISFEK